LEIVKPEIVTLKLPEAMLKMRKLSAPLRCTVNRFAPGPVIVRFLLINNSADVSVIVLLAAREKLIVSPDTAAAMASRNVQFAPGHDPPPSAALPLRAPPPGRARGQRMHVTRKGPLWVGLVRVVGAAVVVLVVRSRPDNSVAARTNRLEHELEHEA